MLKSKKNFKREVCNLSTRQISIRYQQWQHIDEMTHASEVLSDPDGFKTELLAKIITSQIVPGGNSSFSLFVCFRLIY
jgi:hypothetical protein